jgi:hypothetical protein
LKRETALPGRSATSHPRKTDDSALIGGRSEAQRILNQAARRILAERLALEKKAA